MFTYCMYDTHRPTFSHDRIHVHIHTFTQTFKYTRIEMNSYTHMDIHTLTYIHTGTCMHTHTHSITAAVVGLSIAIYPLGLCRGEGGGIWLYLPGLPSSSSKMEVVLLAILMACFSSCAVSTELTLASPVTIHRGVKSERQTIFFFFFFFKRIKIKQKKVEKINWTLVNFWGFVILTYDNMTA